MTYVEAMRDIAAVIDDLDTMIVALRDSARISDKKLFNDSRAMTYELNLLWSARVRNLADSGPLDPNATVGTWPIDQHLITAR